MFVASGGTENLVFAAGNLALDLDGNLSEIVAQLRVFDTGTAINIGLIDPPGFGGGQRFTPGGEVDFSGNPANPRTPMAGDIIRISDDIVNGFRMDFRVYTNGGGDLALAVADRLDGGDLTGDDFYIVNSGTFATTQTPSTGNIGFTELMNSDCTDGVALAGGLRCGHTAETCLAMTPSQIVNNEMCDSCSGGQATTDGMNCVAVTQPPPVETPQTCLAMTPPQIENGGMCESCPNGQATTDGMNCVAATQPPITNPTTGGGGVVAERDDGAETAAYIGAGMVAVGLASYFLWDGNLLAFSFSPDYGYSITESGYAYNFGGRLDFRQDEWHLYYAAGQRNSDGEFGDFRYESGGEYAADFWKAAFSETVQGETADYRFSLSADYSGGIWKVSPTYRLHSRLEEDETETRNSLNLESVLRYNRWTISPSAGFNWRRPEGFGDNARFNLSAVRRF